MPPSQDLAPPPTESTASAMAAPARPGRMVRWYHLYYLLATFDLLTILFSLYVSRQVTDIYRQSIDDSRRWARRLEQIGALRALAAEMNAPGNQVFETHDVDHESRILEGAIQRFRAKLVEEERILHAALPAHKGSAIEPYCADIRRSADAMISEAKQIFAYFRANQPRSAGARMSAMDQSFYRLNGAILALENQVRQYQFDAFQEQHVRAASLRRYEIALATLIVAIVLAAAFYGRQISRSMAAAETRSAEYIAALQRSQEELRRTRDEADAANQAKSRFLAMMSHELRTPMNGVIGLTGLLGDTHLSPHQQDYVDTIRRSGEALLALVNDILDFSKADAGKIELEHVPFDLHETVEEVVDLLAAQAFQKGLSLSSFLDEEAPSAVIGDPSRLRQVLTNLVGNAIKFTEQGKVSVTASVVERSEAAVCLRLAVEDTGVGIPPHLHAKLFESFSQADTSITRKYGGTGLGLAICKSLVELMGGELGVQERAGGGTIFWFTIRLEARAGDSKRTDASLAWADKQVLCVAGDPSIRSILRAYLEHHRIQVDVAADGPSALMRIDVAGGLGRPYDAAIIDCDEQAADGIDLIRQLTSEPGRSPLTVCGLASPANAAALEAARDAGASFSLSKPIRRSQLRTCLSTIFRAPDHGEAGAAMSSEAESAASERAPAATFKARVLVVEDNLISQKVARHLLERFGCRVDLAASGAEAVHLAQQADYDLVFMDCMMPEMDGYEATTRIRANEGDDGRRVPIIAMSAHAVDDERSRCLAAGMDDYIAKPVRYERLAAVLRRWLDAPS